MVRCNFTTQFLNICVCTTFIFVHWLITMKYFLFILNVHYPQKSHIRRTKTNGTNLFPRSEHCMKFARCNAVTCQQMRTCFKAVHSEMWRCPPRDNFRQQLVYHCSTYQITVRFHAFVILLIFFVPGQIRKNLALSQSSSKF